MRVGIVRIYFLSLIIFFLPLSGMNGWVTCGLKVGSCPNDDNFVQICFLGVVGWCEGAG